VTASVFILTLKTPKKHGLFIFRRGDCALFGISVAQNFDENYDWPKKMNKSLFFSEKI
jgi:hypothetical protein